MLVPIVMQAIHDVTRSYIRTQQANKQGIDGKNACSVSRCITTTGNLPVFFTASTSMAHVSHSSLDVTFITMQAPIIGVGLHLVLWPHITCS